MVIRPPTPGLDVHGGVRGLLVPAVAMAVTANIGHENAWWPRHEGFAGQEYSRERRGEDDRSDIRRDAVLWRCGQLAKQNRPGLPEYSLAWMQHR